MMRKWIMTLALLCAAGGAWAGDYSAYTPQQLQEAAAKAVEGEDKNILMAVMQEMQSRYMLFFKKPDTELCDREPPRVGVINVFGRYGTARWAYFTYYRQKAMEIGTCACSTSLGTFDDFMTEKFGTTAAEMTEEDFQAMRDYEQAENYETDERYRAFRAANCRGE